MPGDGITDVAPLTQLTQQQGWYAQKKPWRERAFDQPVHGWIELVTAYESVITAQTWQQYLSPKQRQLDVRTPPLETREEWLQPATIAEVQAQSAAIQGQLGQTCMLLQRPRLLQGYNQWVAPSGGAIPIPDVVVDPTLISNFITWVPALNGHLMTEPQRISIATLRQFNTFAITYLVAQAPVTSYFGVTSEAVGHTQITGGHFVFP